MRSLSGVCFVGGCLALLGGCQRPALPQARQQAEQRWNEVRARVKLQLGRQQYEGRLFEEAIGTLTEAVSLDLRQSEAYILLARANLEQGKTASAQQTLDAARQAGLDSADWHYTQGVIFEQREQFDAALAEYAQARAMDPGQVDYVLAYAECLVGAHRAAEAMQLLEESLHRFDENASVAAAAGHVAILLGDYSRAELYFGQAAVEAGEQPVIAEQYGLLLARAGRCEQAVAVLRPLTLREEFEGSGVLRRALASCELMLGDALAARSWLLDYSHEHPDDVAAGIIVAQAAIESDDLQTADRALALLEQHAPNHPAVTLTRAAWHWRRDEFGAAANVLYDLLEREPTNTDAYCLLAEVLISQNQPEAARHCLEFAHGH